jgi:hypothetical protein
MTLAKGMRSVANYILKTLSTKHVICLFVWVSLCATLVAITGWLSFIGGRSSRYTEVNKDWESCLFEPNAVVLPISEVLDTSPLAPLLAMFGVSIDNMQLPLGSFVHSLVYICINTAALTLLGHSAIALCWKHKGALIETCIFLV